MEIRNVETFLKVAEVLNFTKAANLLGYSQGTVTQQIHQLEDELGTRLFDRTGRSVQLTSSGEQFLPLATDLLNAAGRAASFREEVAMPKGSLTLGVYSGLAQNLLPRVLLRFYRKYPDIDIQVKSTDFFDNITEGLRNNSIDIGLYSMARINLPDFVKFLEIPEETYFLANAAHPLARRRNVPLEEVIREPMFLCDRDVGYSHFMEEELAKRDLYVRPVMEFGYSPSIKALLLENAGISYLPRSIVHEELEKGTLAIIDTESFGIGIWSQFFYHKNRWMNPQMRAFVNYLEDEFTREFRAMFGSLAQPGEA